ncbi:MAG: hypothetical protein KDK72_04580 [Chlamydiia bacterium]|nr:hypothetical protein [Chlamydiia bacterium]
MKVVAVAYRQDAGNIDTGKHGILNGQIVRVLSTIPSGKRVAIIFYAVVALGLTGVALDPYLLDELPLEELPNTVLRLGMVYFLGLTLIGSLHCAEVAALEPLR